MMQLTHEWWAARLGKVGASRVGDIITRTKTGWGAQRANYMAELIAERLTGARTEGFQSASMQWGVDTEPQARDAYEFFTGNQVEQAGFILHARITDSGASPDGLVGMDGCLEIKCPNTATHIETLLWGGTPHKYVSQVQWQMACAGRAWCDFVSFDPRMPADLQFFCFRVKRDDTLIASLEKDVSDFLAELEAKIAALSKLRKAA